jgi:hypothetical protein
VPGARPHDDQGYVSAIAVTEVLTRSDSIADELLDLFQFRKASRCLARKNQLTFDGDFEHSVALRAGLDRVPSESDERLAVWKADVSTTLPAGDGDYRTSPAAFNSLVLRDFSDWGSAWSDGVWREVLEPLLWELKRVTERHRIKLFIVCFPVKYQVDAEFATDFPQRTLQKLTDRMRVPMYDLLPALRAAARASSDPLFYDHCHYTPQGSAVVARAVWTFLRVNEL